MTELRLSRRQLLGGALGVGAVAGTVRLRPRRLPGASPTTAPPLPSTRPTTGTVRDFTLDRPTGAGRPRRAGRVDLGLRRHHPRHRRCGPPPGTGSPSRSPTTCPAPTSVHWHGLAIRNDMDGVPGVTTPEVPPGGAFAFDFVVPDPGTHWFHPHTGLQLDRGLYAPFIIDDPDEPGAYDHEWVIVLDDWTDGVGPSPEQILADLQAAGGRRIHDGWDGRGDDGRRRRRRHLPAVPGQRAPGQRPGHAGRQAGPEGAAADHQRRRRTPSSTSPWPATT